MRRPARTRFDGYVFNPQWQPWPGEPRRPDGPRECNDPSALNWQDIRPFFRDFNATYNGKVYTIPLDGDFHMVYYRKDILDKDGVTPPKPGTTTSSIAQKYNGHHLNGDGKPDYRILHRQEEGCARRLLVDHLRRPGLLRPRAPMRAPSTTQRT